MKAIFPLLFLFIVLSAHARGPMPHERTDVPKLKNSTTGRYMYVGNVPKFDGHELEITISKMNLTARVTAHVSQERIDGYANQLFMRWKTINDALMDTRMAVHPLVKITKLAETKNQSTKLWAKIAEQYSSHVLENNRESIYLDSRNKKSFTSSQEVDEYKDMISRVYFSYLFDTRESADDIIGDNKKFAELLSVQNSRRLFKKHLGHLFTNVPEKEGYVGTLTFVYPIAATVEGPFSQPKEMVTDLLTAESIEARWWSNKWKDEFGGFPFLLIEWSGVAFHGPISNNSSLDVWYLRRDYVSHGCHRMDGSDVLELRALMPTDLKKAAGKIKVTVLDYFDVTDWNKDGVLEVIDVKYYQIPTSVTIAKNKSEEEIIAPYLVSNQQKKFIKNNKYATKYYDETTDTLRNIPKYVFGKKSVTKSGVHQQVGIYRFDYRPNRILQYTEDGVKLQGFDDVAGKYPPKYFQRY